MRDCRLYEPRWVPSHQEAWRLTSEILDSRNMIGIPVGMYSEEQELWDEQELRRQNLKLLEKQYQIQQKIKVCVEPSVQFKMKGNSKLRQDPVGLELLQTRPRLRKHSRSGVLQDKEIKKCSYSEKIEENLDVARARLYWQQRERCANSPYTERSNQGGDLVVEITEDNGNIRTDLQAEEKEENVIVIKVDQANSLMMPPSKIDERNVDNSSDDSEKMLVYENNWKPRPKPIIWDSDVFGTEKPSTKSLEENTALISGEISDCLLDVTRQDSKKNIDAINPPKVDTIESRIPRIKKEIVKCRKVRSETSEEYVASQTSKIFTCKKDRTLLSLDKDKIKDLMIRKWPGKYDSLTPDTTKSRTNFFGNSGSYTLRCNLNPVTQNCSLMYNKKKFYLTPKPNQLNYFKKQKKDGESYETFTARKREFKKYKINSGVIKNEELYERFREYKGNATDTVMW